MTAATPETLLPGITLYPGDCLDVLKGFEPNSVDASVTDAPYGLGREPDAAETLKMLRAWTDGGHYNIRSKSGFMGKEWDAFVPQPTIWKEVYRVLKPGGHVVCFFGTRTYDLGVMAMRLAGFEVRDLVAWLYGSGFPKSRDISKDMDAAVGLDRVVIAQGEAVKRMIPGAEQHKNGWEKNNGREYVPTVTVPASPAAIEWDGWGTALKPAIEPIVLARKPLSEPTVAANVLRWRTGALNIDGCRVEFIGAANEAESKGKNQHADFHSGPMTNEIYGKFNKDRENYNPPGRHPANVVHDGSDEVVGAFPSARSAGIYDNERNVSHGMFGKRTGGATFNDSGSAARFFYSAKADDEDRLGSKHPTVKPVDLMRYAARLVTPPGGLVLDPFAGTGTTGEACLREGLRAALIEKEPEYQDDIRRRMKLALAGSEERARAIVKEKMKGKPVDLGPLFANGAP